MVDIPTPTSWNEASWKVLRWMASTEDEMKHLGDTDDRLIQLRHLQLNMAVYIKNMLKFGGSEAGISLLVGEAVKAGCVAIGHDIDTEESFDYGAMHGVLCRKQHDYGHENINLFGVVGVCVRLCDKIARLMNLYENDIHPDNESVDDTWTDIVGYSVIAKMLEWDWFKLELEENFNEPF